MEALRLCAASRWQGRYGGKPTQSRSKSRSSHFPPTAAAPSPLTSLKRTQAQLPTRLGLLQTVNFAGKAANYTKQTINGNSSLAAPASSHLLQNTSYPIASIRTLNGAALGTAKPLTELATASLRRRQLLQLSARIVGGKRMYSSTPEEASSIKVGESPNGEVTDQKKETKVRTEPPKPPHLLVLYLQLAKARLGSMVVLSTMFGYLLAPGAFDLAMFAPLVIGTSFTVASANSINQYLEIEYDSMMKRTRNRPLPAGHLTPNHALAFGITTGALGTVILGTIVNPISASLAFANIILYTLVYTPMKRVHPLNTAVGAIVGAIPPLIGWAAQTGGLEAGAWVSFLILALWQMPHFHALSWPLRHDYGNAGYRMLVNVKPERVPLHTFAYTLATLGLGPFAVYTGLAVPHFAWLGALPCLPWIYYSYKFYTQRTNVTGRQSFKWSLYWLPLFLGILTLCLAPDRDRDTIEEDVIAMHQQITASQDDQ